MELLTIILTLLFIFPLTFPFILLRTAIYCLSFYLQRKHSITISVAKCGLISFRSIEIKFLTKFLQKNDVPSESKSLVSVTIESLRLSSLYLDNSCTSILSVCLSNISVILPLEDGRSMPVKVGTLELPIDKIGGDFFRHYKENFNVSVSDIVIVLENFSYKIQRLDVAKSSGLQRNLNIEFNRVIFSDLSIPETHTYSEMPEELTNQRILFIEQLQVLYLTSYNKSLQINVNGDCFLQWNLEFHMNVTSLVSAIKGIALNFKSATVNKKSLSSLEPNRTSKQPLTARIDLDGRLSLGALITENQTVCLNTQSLEVTALFPGSKYVRSKSVCLHFDDHTIVACSMLTVTHHPDPGVPSVLDRNQNSCGIKLADSTNGLLCVDIDLVQLSFPYKYDFASAFNEKFLGIIKWLRKYHKGGNTSQSGKGSVGFDMSFRVARFEFEIEDDPFESKLRTNYMLLEDEYHEQLKRDQTLQEKINELKKTNLMLASSIVEELNRALAKKNSDIYVQRSKQLYSAEESKKTPLFKIIIEEADLKVIADSSFHKHSDIRSILKTINPEGQLTEEISFSTIWCRIISSNFKSIDLTLRDFPLPLVSLKDLTVKGKVVGSEQTAVPRAKRSCSVYVGRNSGVSTVERSMTPMKIFHNLQLRCTSGSYTNGPCWEPVLQQVSIAFDDIVSSSSDPSPSLPWWDKMRFIYHGQIKLNCNQLSILLHASNDPYNQTELLELTIARSYVDLSTGKIRIKGDFDALLRTASKYDECRFIHIPNLDVSMTLDWNCLGGQHDHYSVMPCAPDKVPDYSSYHSHDSYRSFRSQSLNLNLNFETQFTSPTSSMNPENMPSMLFFGSTIRWLENQKVIFVGPSKLTRRGKLFNNTKPKKPSFTRVFKDIRLTITLNRFQILYWSSVSKKHGIHIMGGELTHSSEHTLKLITGNPDGLKHRLQSDWQTIYMNSSLSNVEVWLYNLGFEDLDEFNEFNLQSNLKNRQYFVSFNQVSYNKEARIKREEMDEFEMSRSDNIEDANIDLQSSKSDEHVPNHRLIVHDLKAAWTKDNRDVVVGIFDAFMNSQQLKRNLSTEALKPLRIEQPVQHQTSIITNNSPPYRHQRHPSTTSLILNNVINPVSSVSKNRAVSMLQKLIADSENNPNVYTEETHSGVSSGTHLYGVEACQMDDVIDINLLIELVNSQVVLCGTETPGYVIVSAASTEIRHATHLPVWKNRTLLSKSTWTGCLKCMQYYATVDVQSPDANIKPVFTNENDIQWLKPDNIDSRATVNDVPDMVGSGHSVGGVVSPVVGRSKGGTSDYSDSSVQLQRIISRCNCLFYYASHTERLPDDLTHLIPPLPDEDMFIEPWDKEVGVDSFTLTHQDLEISTNSQQFAMIMDIINNLLLFVEPHKKTAFEKLERMRFQFQLSPDLDQREPISQLQDQVRKCVAYLKRLERERYLVYRASIDDSMESTSLERDYRHSLHSLSVQIQSFKEQLNSASEELAMMISCYRELQLGAHKAQKQQAASQQGTGAFFANVIKRNEICFQSARWRMTDSDGQLGLADIVLNNFLYSKVVKSDDSVEHTIELGHLHVSNLIPNQPYKDVLHPTELQANIPLDRQRALRVYCRELAPVGGIPVKEHLEVNVIPFTIEVTLQFFQKMVRYFFPEREVSKEEKSKSRVLDLSGEHQISRFGSKRKNKQDKNAYCDSLASSSTTGGSGGSGNSKNSGITNSILGGRQSDDTISMISTATVNSTTTVSSLNSNQRRGEEIEKMRERASKNHTFVYVKIPGIPIKVSYKGKKQKSVTDLKNMSLTLPTYEYHNSTWTWLDLFEAVKNDSKHTVIKQALKQKMKIRPSSIWSKSNSTEQHSPSSESSPKEKNPIPVTDEDKARLLLGQYANIKTLSRD